jgi:CHAT domain-containing protein/tetratricopeptide (TPR) repeat protein
LRGLAYALSYVLGLGMATEADAFVAPVAMQLTPAPPPPVAELGVPLELSLEPGVQTAPSMREFSFVAAAAGTLTIDASSYDAAVVLARLGGDGAVLQQVDDGGIGWNARLVVAADAGEPLRLSAGFGRAVSGKVVVTVTAGEAPMPTGFELGRATAQFHLQCGKAAEARGDALFAAAQYDAAGQAFYNLALYADCQQAYSAALPLADRIGHAPLKMVSQGFLGAVALRFGNASEARDLLVPACAGAVEQKQARFEMFCQSNLSDACQRLDDMACARSACDRALAVARELKDSANEAGILVQSASLAVLEGDAATARDMYEQARHAAEAVGQPDQLALMLNEQARYHLRRGELQDAEASLLEALDRATYPAVRAATKGELGNLRNEQGRWPEAVSLYQEVLDTARELGDVGLETAALTNLGVVHGRAGDTPAANAAFQQALSLDTNAGDALATVQVLVQLASLRYEEDRSTEARALLEQARTVAKSASSDELAFSVAYPMALLASKDPGRQAEAGRLAEEAQEIAQRTGSRADSALALSLLAWCRLLQGRLDEAAETVARAVASSLDAAPHVRAAALSTQIDIALARRDLATARSALTGADELLAGLPLSGMATEEASLARANWSYAQFSELEQDVVALALSSAAKSGTRSSASASRDALVAEGFRAAGRSQARALLEGISEHRSGRRDAQSTALRRERQQLLADRQTVLEAVARSRRGGASGPAIEPMLEHARRLAAEADSALDELRRHAPEEAALDAPAELDPGQVQRDLLGDEDVLVQYAEGQEHLYAYVLTRTAVEWHDLGERAAIGELVRSLLDRISEPTQLAGPGDVAVTGVEAWTALLKPLLPAGGSGTLIVVPTPLLAALPFEALVTEGDAKAKSFADLRFVIDRYDVRYVPSPAVMSLLAAAPARSGDSRMLVLADPIVPSEEVASQSVPRLATESPSLARLPGTRIEAMAIVDLLETAVASSHDVPKRLPDEQRGGHLETELVDVFLGPDATAAPLQEAGRRYAIVHVAAHGKVDSTDPARSGLVLSPTAQDDGFLSVPEVLDLDLDADLVVLSACDTARGPVRRGEGLQSLARAFMYAGARSVIATLWQVDDRETETAMTLFYKGLRQGGMDSASALRQARLFLRNASAGATGFAGTGRGNLLPGSPQRQAAGGDTSRGLGGHPYFWAPFISIGWSPRSR